MTKAARLGYITKDGYDVSHNAKAHCRPVTKWKSNLFEQKS
jgi:hypothetical protein